MVHLSSARTKATMVAYSVLTYGVGPTLTRPYLRDHPDQCPAGFLLGLLISVAHWMKYARHWA